MLPLYSMIDTMQTLNISIGSKAYDSETDSDELRAQKNIKEGPKLKGSIQRE